MKVLGCGGGHGKEEVVQGMKLRKMMRMLRELSKFEM
jgi:hypothetical protein